jgi:hypothetical protein
MIVLADLARIDAPMARHPEVEHEGVAAVGFDEPVLGASAKAGHACAGQPLAEIDRKRAAQVRPANLDAADAAALQHTSEAADGGFDFGQLRHGGDMAEPPQAR